MFKKCLALLLCAVMLFCVVACDDSTPSVPVLDDQASGNGNIKKPTAGTGGAQTSDPVTSSTNWLNIASYNIHHGYTDLTNSGAPETFQMDNIINFIIEKELDVIGMQEVDYKRARSGYVDTVDYFVKELEEKTGEKWYGSFSKSLEFEDQNNSAYGNAIISRYPIISSRTVKLWADGQTQQIQSMPDYTWEARSVLISDILVGDKTFTMMCTHLDLEHNARVKGAQTIVQEVQRASHPVVVLGDMNAGYSPANANNPEYKGNQVVNIFRSAMTCTDNMSAPISGIDWIFVKNLRYSGINVPHKAVAYYSDHQPTLVKIAFTD